MSEQDPFAGGKEVSEATVSWGKAGDYLKGTYVGKKLVASKNAYLYEVKAASGSYHQLDELKAVKEPAVVAEPGGFYKVWGREKGKEGVIDDLFAKCKFGEIIAIQFKESQPSKTKGNAPFKLFKAMTFGVDPEYMGEDSTVTGEHIDF